MSVTVILFSVGALGMVTKGLGGGNPCGIVANVLDYDIIVNQFKLHLCYYVHFWTNILGKGMNSLNPLAVG